MMADIQRFTAADADWVVDRHAALYAEHEGFDASFGVLVRQIVTDFLAGHDPGCEAGWIAWGATGDRVGSIFVVAEAPGVAKLRLVLVEPAARGTGLAQALLDTALAFARGAAYRKMRLWTHESHRAAGRMYARNGFVRESARPEHAFGRDVVTEFWTRDL